VDCLEIGPVLIRFFSIFEVLKQEA
jgi:hypothetical protein